MDFKQFVKNVKNEASDAVEITKLKAKISSEKTSVKEMYETYLKTKEAPEEFAEQMAKVDAARAKIAEYNAEIDKVKMSE